RTKDLRLAMWLTEALAMLEGFAGLDKGLLLCTRLCEAHWAALHPRADDGDLEERAGNIRWLLQRVVNLAQTLPVTQGRHGGAFSLQDMAVARQRQLAQERQTDEAARQPADALTPEQFSRALKETPPPVLRATLAAARNCLAHLLVWQGIVDRHMGAEGPGFVQAKEALASTVHELERLGRECGALDEGGGLGATSGLQREAGAGSAGTFGIPEAADAGAAGSLPGGPPRSRAH